MNNVRSLTSFVIQAVGRLRPDASRCCVASRFAAGVRLLAVGRLRPGAGRCCVASRFAAGARLLAACLFLLFLLQSCDRRPLEVIVSEKVKVRLVVKWRINFVDIYGTEPTGMTVMVWDSRGSLPIVETTNDDHVTLLLDPDEYHLIVFNQMEREYLPYMRFYQQASFHDFVARNTTYVSPTDHQTYTHYPDPIGVAVDTFLITRDMVMQDTTIFVPYEEYISSDINLYTEKIHVYEIPEVPWPMTVNVNLLLNVRHRQSVKGIKASISGLADGFYLSRIIRTTEKATIEFDAKKWNFQKYGDERDSLGQITNATPSFGLPYGKELLSQRDSTDNVLNLSVTLVNDSVLSYTFNVGKHIRYITPEGREAEIRYRQDLQNLRLEIDLPDIIDLPVVDGNAGAGFDAEVVDWDDGGIIDMGGYSRRR